MEGHTEIHIFVSPKQLRGLADDIENMYKNLVPGNSNLVGNITVND